MIDDNYHVVRSLVWSRLQAVVWLDHPLIVILRRLWIRTWRRVLSGEHLWGTNYERLGSRFFSRDSLFLWALQTYRRRRREYGQMLAATEYAHLHAIHLTSTR